MKAIAMTVAAAVLAAWVCGCGTMLPTVKDVDMSRIADSFYDQPNTAEVLKVKGANVEWTIKGASEITLSTPVPTKSMIPREPGVIDSIGNLFGSVVPWAVGAYVGGKLADRPATVSQQVVKPEVVTVPAGP